MPMKSKHKPKRKKRSTRIARQIVEANRLAALIIAAPIDGTDFAAPGLIRDPRLAPALAVWRELTPLLAARGILDNADRLQLATLAYWYSEFIVAADDLLKRGYSVMVKTISGDRMPRKNASASRRDHAFDKLSELSTRFGLTPLDRYALQRAAKAVARSDQLSLGGSDEVDTAGGEVAVWGDVVTSKPN
jgi:P27 family predicted phage terminase small subunit